MTQEQLQALTGYQRPSDIKKCLESQGIRVYTGKDGRVFTLDTHNDEPEPEKIEFLDA